MSGDGKYSGFNSRYVLVHLGHSSEKETIRIYFFRIF